MDDEKTLQRPGSVSNDNGHISREPTLGGNASRTMTPEERSVSNEKPAVTDAEANKDVEAAAPPALKGPFALPLDHPMHPSKFPDSGAKAWLTVAGGFALLFCSFGWINCIGIFQAYYENGPLSSYDSSTIGWILSLELFFMFALGFLIGKVYDAYGARPILIFGGFMHVFGLMMTSLSTEYYQFVLAQGICSPIGAGCLFYPAINATTTWFFKKRGLALGIVVSGSSLGGVILPIMLDRLIQQIGFPWAMRTVAFLFLGLILIAIATTSQRVPPPGWTPVKHTDFTAHFKDKLFVVTVFSSFIFFFGMFQGFSFIALYGLKYGMSVSMSNYLVAILNAGSVFGRLIPGALADKFGRYNVLIIISYLSGISTLAIWLPSRGPIPIIIYAVVYGFATGGYVSLMPACIAQITKDLRQIGVRNGTAFAVISFAALTGVPIGGAIITREHGGFQGVQIFGGVMMVAGSTGLFLARMMLSEWKLKAVV